MALVFSGLILARAALSAYTGGRAATDTMYDTNDLAYLLVTVFPLSVGFLITSKTRLWWVINAGIGAILLGALLLTQSRGGFLGLAAVVAGLIFMPIKARERGSTKKGPNRFLLLLGVLGLSVVVVRVASGRLRAIRDRLRFRQRLQLGSQQQHQSGTDIDSGRSCNACTPYRICAPYVQHGRMEIRGPVLRPAQQHCASHGRTWHSRPVPLPPNVLSRMARSATLSEKFTFTSIPFQRTTGPVGLCEDPSGLPRRKYCGRVLFVDGLREFAMDHLRNLHGSDGDRSTR